MEPHAVDMGSYSLCEAKRRSEFYSQCPVTGELVQLSNKELGRFSGASTMGSEYCTKATS
jgi:hypothetical protein